MSSPDSYVGPAYSAGKQDPVSVEWGARCLKPCCDHTSTAAPFMAGRDRGSVERWIATQERGQYVLVSRPIYGWAEVDSDELDH